MNKIGFYFIISPDFYLIKEKIGSLSEQVFNSSAQISYFWADEGLDINFWNKFVSLSFEQKNEIIVVRNAQSINADTWKKLSKQLANIRADILPVFCLEVEYEKNAPKIPAYISKLKCFEFAKQKNWLEQIPNLNESAIIKRLLDNKKTLELDNTLAKQIAKVILPEASAVDNALNILYLACPNGKINSEHIELLTSEVYNFDIFTFIQNMQSAKYDELWTMYIQDANTSEDRFFPFLALLARETRILWQLLAEEPVSLPPFIINNKKRLSAGLGKAILNEIFIAIARADFYVKSGQKSTDQSFEEMIAKLTILFKGKYE